MFSRAVTSRGLTAERGSGILRTPASTASGVSMTASATSTSRIDRFFEITARGSTIGREVRGGVVTFFTMAYIIVLNPLILTGAVDETGAYIGGGSDPGQAAVMVGA